MAGFSTRVDAAWRMAHDYHREQVRKVTGIPFVAHLLQVAGMVAEMGGSEDEVIAALLHDAAEDQGGEATLAEIRQEFGDHVARMVADCSDTFVMPKPPWRARKEGHLAKLANADDGVLRIKLADKIHNASCILRDARERGGQAFDSFQGGKAGTLWYFEAMLALFERRIPSSWTDELATLVRELAHYAKET